MKRVALLGGLLFAVSAVAGLLVSPGFTERNDGATITIWVDGARNRAVTKVAGDWAVSRGVTVDIVTKDFGQIRDALKTVDAASAPDVIVGAHEWTGQLAAEGLILPLSPSKATLAQFPKNALDAFSSGIAVRRLYGAPVTLENIGLVVNLKLAHVPRTFADFESQAVLFKRRKAGNIALAVPQGGAGDAYHMYPFFSGLGGYVFGRNRAGNLDPSDIGLRSPRFIAGVGLIDKWSREGLLDSAIDYDIGKNAFLNGQAAFWLTGPSEATTLKTSGIKLAIIQLPAIEYPSVPFLRAQGFLVTTFAAEHGLATLANDLVAGTMMAPDAQGTLAAASGLLPANMIAARRVRDPVLTQLGKAGAGAVPVPNIPQMEKVWPELGGAWARSTKGPGSLAARAAFSTAARNIAYGIG